MSMGEIIGTAFFAGYLVGVLLNRKPPIIRGAKVEANLIVSHELIEHVNARIDQESVNAWLDKRGLVWQPKGAVFELNKDAKK